MARKHAKQRIDLLEAQRELRRLDAEEEAAPEDSAERAKLKERIVLQRELIRRLTAGPESEERP
jgi:hypothetical protein